jgi:uncharacterized lipoprotein YddW (UPF0748 family)
MGSSDTDDTSVVDTTPRELRGIWVTRWTYSSEEDITALIQDIANAGFNTVYFQIRGNFDAYYDSSIEPWAKGLTGELGKDPGWDPLQTAVTVGHEQNLEIHAYINVFPFWSGSTPPSSSTPTHAYLEHPDWVVADEDGKTMELRSGYVFASPGNPDVRARVAAVAADIESKYAVDGIHLDYIRYPGDEYSHDPVSEAAFAASGATDWGNWQREQVKATVGGVSEAVSVPVSAAVWGIYENSFGWSSVSQGNISYYQDSWAFLTEGLLDANVPMIYWSVKEERGERLDFQTLVAEHVAHSGDRHVYAGINAELGLDGVVECIEAARREQADGVVLFDYSLGEDWLAELRTSVFAEDRAPPKMPWR